MSSEEQKKEKEEDDVVEQQQQHHHHERLPASPGKVSSEFLEKVIYPNLGAVRPEVVVGPSQGVDTCVIRIDQSRVLVATTDPLSLIPELGPSKSAWMSVNLLANDLSTSGFSPQYLMVDLNLPLGVPDAQLEEYWNALSQECSHLGIAIVGGHTGKFEGLNSTMLCTGSAQHCLTTKGAKHGDSVILTKGAAISATGILSQLFPDKIAERIGTRALAEATKYFSEIAAIHDALAVAGAGVTAMHDVTEGGVLSALYELASASSLGLTIEKEEIPVSEESSEICRIFGLDPYVTLGEGALVISCAPTKTEEVLRILRQRGTRASVVGVLDEHAKAIRIREKSGVESSVQYPVVDPYWSAYYDAVSSRSRSNK